MKYQSLILKVNSMDISEYIKMIKEKLDECNDVALLDLILQLLHKSNA